MDIIFSSDPNLNFVIWAILTVVFVYGVAKLLYWLAGGKDGNNGNK